MKILSFDPGGTTGWCLCSFSSDIPEAAPALLQVGEHSGDHKNMLKWLNYIFMNYATPDVKVVCEAYRIYPSMARDHINSDVPTLRLIGAIELLCCQFGLSITLQMASDAKQLTPDSRLKSLGLYQTSNRHANDSIRHVLLFIRRYASVRRAKAAQTGSISISS